MLVEGIFETVVSLVCEETATLVETAIVALKFNRVCTQGTDIIPHHTMLMHGPQLGGMQLDKDIRMIVGYMASLTQWSIRDKFARLSQIALLLNLEQVGIVS